jgi:hypothetical protein
VRSVEFRPVLAVVAPLTFLSTVASLVKVELSDFWPASPAFLEPAVVVFAILVRPYLSLRSSSSFAVFSLILSALDIILLWPGFPGLPALFSRGDLASACACSFSCIRLSISSPRFGLCFTSS